MAILSDLVRFRAHRAANATAFGRFSGALVSYFGGRPASRAGKPPIADQSSVSPPFASKVDEDWTVDWQPMANSRTRRLRKVKGRQQACIGWGNLVTLGMFLRLPL